MLALRLAARELRGGVRGLRIVLACLALGVAVIAGVGSLREAIDRGLKADGRALVGGDLSLESGAQPVDPAVRDWLTARGARLSSVTVMRSMLIAPSGERQLVELKAVDNAWPMVGEATFDPPQAVAAALDERDGRFGLAAEKVVLDRLGVHPGDLVRLGSATLTVRGALTAEPDRATGAGATLAPRAIIAAEALPATGMMAPGAIIQSDVRVALPPGTDLAAFKDALEAAFPNQGWRVRDFHNAAPGLTRFIDQTSLFMTLVGLTSLLVGGIGAATGVRSWLEGRARTIATLRSLGASGRLVFAVCMIQVMALSLLGVVVGLAGGAALPWLIVGAMKSLLPVTPQTGVFPGPLALAGLFGLLTAAAFTLWPLGRATRISGAALFRDAILPEGAWPPMWVMAANAVAAAALVGLTVFVSADRRFALWFCGAALLTLGLFRLGGWTLMALARAAPRMRSPVARLGIANLHRPGSATPLMLVAVGLGLSTLAAVVLIEANIRRELADQLPAQAPTFFFVDIQNDQIPAFEALVAAQPGAGDVREAPSLRARVVAINGVPAGQVPSSAGTRWALRSELGLTYATDLPDGSTVVSGQWWPADYAGPPLLSLDQGMAEGWGVHVGDVVRINVLGRNIDLKVASLRDIEWRSLSINYFMVASPGLLQQAPHTHIATVRTTPAAEAPLLRAVTDALPNVTGILVADVLKAVSDLLDKIAASLAATGSLTLVEGALVLAGAVAAGQRRRTQEAVILKSLGATRGQIRAAWLVEFGVLGATAGLIAACVGAAASYGVVRYVMNASWSLLPGVLTGTLALCIVLMLGFGYAGTASALRAKAAPWLRND